MDFGRAPQDTLTAPPTVTNIGPKLFHRPNPPSHPTSHPSSCPQQVIKQHCIVLLEEQCLGSETPAITMVYLHMLYVHINGIQNENPYMYTLSICCYTDGGRGGATAPDHTPGAHYPISSVVQHSPTHCGAARHPHSGEHPYPCVCVVEFVSNRH